MESYFFFISGWWPKHAYLMVPLSGWSNLARRSLYVSITVLSCKKLEHNGKPFSLKNEYFFKKDKIFSRIFRIMKDDIYYAWAACVTYVHLFSSLVFPKHFHFHNYHAWLGPTHYTYSQDFSRSIQRQYIRKIYIETFHRDGVSVTVSCTQRHILRDRRCGTTAWPACWTMGTNEVK